MWAPQALSRLDRVDRAAGPARPGPSGVTAARGVGRTMKESEDIKRAGEDVEAVKAQAAELDAEVLAETQRITSRFEAESPLEKVALVPKRGQVTVQFVALGWVPVEEGALGA